MHTAYRRQTSRHTSHASTALLFGAMALTGAACVDATSAPNVRHVRSAPQTPAPTISDGAHGGSTRLYFLPPLVPAPTYSGTFDPTAFAPGSGDEVYVCLLVASACVARVETFGPTDVQVDLVNQLYHVSWPVRNTTLQTSLSYRLVVHVGGQDVGYADIVVVVSPSAKKGVDPAQFVAVALLGGIVPIHFRLEGGTPPVLHTVSVAASPAAGGTASVSHGGCQGSSCTVPQGGTATLTAIPSVGYTFSQWSANCTGATSPQFDLVVTASEVCTAQFAFVPPTTVPSIGLGPDHTCSLALDGVAYCWGANNGGVLGDGTNQGGTFTPQPVFAPTSFRVLFTRLDADWMLACGLAGLPGTPYCWPFNGSLEPVAVLGGLTFNAITVGHQHACGLTTAGAAYCWGSNFGGALGDGGVATFATTPVAVTGGHTFAMIDAGGGATCGITTVGVALCWGYNAVGILGDGTTTNRSSPTPVTSGLTFSNIAVGNGHACAITTASEAYCWGQNSEGELGNNSLTPSFTPTLVGGGLTVASIRVMSHTSCALTSAGVAYCWGRNSQGQVGDGTFTLRRLPSLVSGGHTFASINPGGNHTCALTTANVAYCWGLNSSGQLGDGTQVNRNVPTLVIFTP